MPLRESRFFLSLRTAGVFIFFSDSIRTCCQSYYNSKKITTYDKLIVRCTLHILKFRPALACIAAIGCVIIEANKHTSKAHYISFKRRA